jgi:hypothetical protein
MWARTDPNLRDAPRAREVKEELRKQSEKLAKGLWLKREDVELSARQILRIVKGAAYSG